jgi:protein-S-isoprenylcysteine O-methyltransferase Ste14
MRPYPILRRRKATEQRVTKTANRRLIEQLVVGAVIGAAVGFKIAQRGWHPSRLFAGNTSRFNYDVEWNRLTPALLLWVLFFLYWSIASRDSAPTATSESRVSSYFHQLVLSAALVLLFWQATGLTGWFLPQRFHFLVAVGAALQAGFILLAVWSRRHLGRNWSAEVRIGEGHELVRTGPYRVLRHPIYTAMLGMFLGTTIASSQYHALLGLAVLVVAYLRKTRLEEQILHRTFGPDYEAYRRETWALVPLFY